MKNRPTLAAIVFLLAVACAPQTEVTTVILVRHAEKAAVAAGAPADDPALSPEGAERAELLATMLRFSGIETVISSQYERTRATVAPLAAALGLMVTIIRAQEQEALIEAITTTYRGQTILIVGHSNTVPSIMADLGVEDPPAISDDEYGDLFIVQISEGILTRRTEMTRLAYGE